jgi:hypothetical protein
MELTSKDKAGNVILALLVSPRNNRLYDYYINGLSDKRVMLQRKMLQFCIDLCPDHAAEIRRCIFELHPFIIYPQDQKFNELKENDPPKINRRNLLFPMGKPVREDKINLSKEKEDHVEQWAKNFSIWNKYNIHIEMEKKRKSVFDTLNNRPDQGSILR